MTAATEPGAAPRMPGAWRRHAPWVLAAAFYVTLTVVQTWPLVTKLSEVLPHDFGDPGLNAWIIWWNAQAVPLTERWWNAPIFFPSSGALAFSETLLGLLPERIVYEDVITFPALRQDLAFVVDEDTSAGDLVGAAREAAGPDLRDMRVFDVYRGEGIPEGRKSVAFHAEFRSPDRTLSDEDARELREKIVAALGAQFAAELRA